MEAVAICKILFQQIDVGAIASCNSRATINSFYLIRHLLYASILHPYVYDPINTRMGSYA